MQRRQEFTSCRRFDFGEPETPSGRHLINVEMKLLRWLAPLLLFLSGCSPSTQTPPPSPLDAPATPTTPPDAIRPTAPVDIPAEGTTPATPSPPSGWQTYTHPDLQVALDYPAGWTFEEGPEGATFRPPDGTAIHLRILETAGEVPGEDDLGGNQLPNTRCSSGTNDYGVAFHTCFDTLSGSTTAFLSFELPQGSQIQLSLSMLRHGDREIFSAMVSSTRPAASP